MKDKNDLIEKADKIIKRIKSGNAFTIDLEACRLIEEMRKEIKRLRGIDGEKK